MSGDRREPICDAPRWDPEQQRDVELCDRVRFHPGGHTWELAPNVRLTLRARYVVGDRVVEGEEPLMRVTVEELLQIQKYGHDGDPAADLLQLIAGTLNGSRPLISLHVESPGTVDR